MNTRYVLHVACYEAKQQVRDWVFWLFTLFSTAGIISWQVLLQGQGYGENWKLVALPCSVPLVNAYLFCVVQSLFIIIVITDFPRRENTGGSLESIYVRPMENNEYTWGRVLGCMLLCAVVNIFVILACVLLVNLESLASIDFRYYLFYFLTLNIPSLLFMTGLSLWLARIVKNRYLARVLLVSWLVLSVSWLPYHLHGTLDFLATGIPNLFSGLLGHVGLGYYLSHRFIFLLVGLGLVSYSVRKMNRLTGHPRQIKLYAIRGLTFIVTGIFCGLLLEGSYFPTRKIRENYRESFSHHWMGTPCHVERHEIRTKQQGDRLTMESNLTLLNLNESTVNKPLLFLNPGLQVKSLKENGQTIPFDRDNQVIIIDRKLPAGDSLCIRICYEGNIDESYTDLQLPDNRHENSFRGDFFFPTGRRSAFVKDNYLLLTPATAWYPAGLPPVNPVRPMYSGRDVTKFRTVVIRPNQRVLFSQGVKFRSKDSVVFEPSSYLSGISLCGGNFTSRILDIDSLKFSLNTFQEPDVFLEHFAQARPEGIKAYFQSDFYFNPDLKLSDLSWAEHGVAHVRFIETPVSFLLEFNEGKFMSGQVEPGMTFLPEKGFGMDLMGILNIPISSKGEKDNRRIRYIGSYDTESEYFHEIGQSIALKMAVETVGADAQISHPLLKWRKKTGKWKYTLWNAMAMFYDTRSNVYSAKYPFADFLFRTLYSDKSHFVSGRLAKPFIYNFSGRDEKQLQAYIRYHCLENALQDREVAPNILYHTVRENLFELTNYLGPKISLDSLFMRLEEVYHKQQGIISLEQLAKELKIEGNIRDVFDKWLRSGHNQYFAVRDLTRNFYPGDEDHPNGWVEIKGKVMNRGKEGGFVFMKLITGRGKENYGCYIKPGEAKAFRSISTAEGLYYPSAVLNTGMAINRPNEFSFIYNELPYSGSKVETPAGWIEMDTSVFQPSHKEIIVDNLDPNFSYDDRANQTLFQKWFGVKRTGDLYTKNMEERFWNPLVNKNFYGDSIRHAYYKSFGSGKCTATWKTNIKEAGKYRIMVMVHSRKINNSRIVDDDFYSEIIFYYTVRCKDWLKEVELWPEVTLKEVSLQLEWLELGVFDLPAEEVSVTLSDKDKKGRKNMVIFADAVKWMKLDE